MTRTPGIILAAAVLTLVFGCQSRDGSTVDDAPPREPDQPRVTYFGTGIHSAGAAYLADVYIAPSAEADLRSVLYAVTGYPLKHRRVIGLKISGEGTDELLASVTRFPSLRWIDLKEARGLSAEGVAHLPRSASLRKVVLPRHCDGAAESMLAALHPMVELEWLSLPSEAHTAEGLASLSRFSRLAELHVAGSPRIDDRVAATFARLGALERLVLRGAHALTDAGLDALASSDSETFERLYLGRPEKASVDGLRRLLEAERPETVLLEREYAQQHSHVETSSLASGVAMNEWATTSKVGCIGGFGTCNC